MYSSIVHLVAESEHWHKQFVVQAEAECQQQLVLPQSRYDQAKSQAESSYQQMVQQAEESYKQKLASVQARYEQAKADVARLLASESASFRETMAHLTEQSNRLSPPWDSTGWTAWNAASSAPVISRLGTWTFAANPQPVLFPALLDFPMHRSLLFKSPGSAKQMAVQAIQSFLLRLLATIPPGKVRFTFIDPIGLGQNVAPFMHLADYDEALVTGKAWTEPHHIEQRLADLTEHTENVIQKYLRNQFATIEAYNEKAGEIAEAYRIVVVFDFPANFNETAARRLLSIAQNGPRCGVYTVVLVDSTKPMPHGFNSADLEQHATMMTWDGQRFVWRDEDFQTCVLQLDAPPQTELLNRIIQTIGKASQEANKVEVPFDRIVPAADQWWKGDSRDGLNVPLGPAGARKVQHLDLGKGMAHHALIVGKIGSGKSTLLHTLIISTILTYSPDEIELYLIDFKKGVEFKCYATYQLSHARVIAIESEREFGLSVLVGLDSELKRRGDLFRARGVDHLAPYRQETSDPLPRIVLIVDEFQEFFTEDDSIASQSSQILDRLVRQGRGFGIHIVLSSQTLAGTYTLARSTIDQMAVRIALQCSEADSRLILADDNPAARLLSRPGEAIYNAANGLVEGNNLFQVAWLPDEQRDHYLEQVRTRSQQQERPQIIFEGNVPANVEKNHLLRNLITTAQPVSLPKAVHAWLGDPVAIRDPVAASFQRQSGSNMLIVGQDDEAALGLMATAIVSVAAHLPSPTKKSIGPILILDFSMADVPHADFLKDLSEYVPHITAIGKRKQLPSMIDHLDKEVERRMENEESAAPPIFLFVYGLQRARDLRQDESLSFASYGEETLAANPAQQFAHILREGADVGVHTIVWCDTAANLYRTMDRRTVREFAMRVVFQMSADDSTNLIDTPAANKLGLHRAFFYHEEEGKLEKFRPYGLPSQQWLNKTLAT